MLSIDTLSNKPQVVNQNNETIVDLTAATFIYKKDVTVTGSAIVSDDFEMRPDLVAKVSYGDISKVDYILKFNGISNPFSLESGTILLIGDINEMKNNFTSVVDKDPDKKQQDIRKAFFDPTRLSKKDTKRLELIQQKSKSFSNASSNLPPNMAPIGSQEISVQNGVVVFGGDVTAIKDNCPEPLSRAQVKSKLIANKIFANTNK